MPKSIISEADALSHFGMLFAHDVVSCETCLRDVIVRLVDFYENVRIHGASDQMLLAAGTCRMECPAGYAPDLFDCRTGLVRWEYCSNEEFVMIEVRRYIQFTFDENDTSLDCRMYFPTALVPGPNPKGAYSEIFEHDRVDETITQFFRNETIASLLDSIPQQMLVFVTTVW